MHEEAAATPLGSGAHKQGLRVQGLDSEAKGVHGWARIMVSRSIYQASSRSRPPRTHLV